MTINSEPQLNDADSELLSAYIDRQLSDGERATLEQRLKNEPALQSALAELRATVTLLRELEPLRPPRSFTIEAPAVASRRGWAFPWRVFGSGLIAVICLVAFSFALIRSSGSQGGIASAPNTASQNAAAAPTAAPAAAAPMAAPAFSAPTTAAAAAAGASAAEAPTAAEAVPLPPAAAAAAAPTAAPAAAAAPAQLPQVEPSPPAPQTTARESADTAAPKVTPEAANSNAATAAPGVPIPPPDSAAVEPTASYAQGDQSATANALGSALEATQATPEHPFNATVTTPVSSSPDTLPLQQPTIVPNASSVPRGASNLGLIGIALLLLALVAAVVVLVRRQRQ